MFYYTASHGRIDLFYDGGVVDTISLDPSADYQINATKDRFVLSAYSISVREKAEGLGFTMTLPTITVKTIKLEYNYNHENSAAPEGIIFDKTEKVTTLQL